MAGSPAEPANYPNGSLGGDLRGWEAALTAKGVAMPTEHDGAAVPNGALRVAVQQRQRFFRVGLARLLDDAPEVDFAGAAVTAPDLVRLCSALAPQIVAFELDDPTADPCRTAATLRAQHRGIRFVGLVSTSDESLRPVVRACFPTRARRSEGLEALLDAVRAAPTQPLVPIALPEDDDAGHALTSRERAVLTLVGSGCTTREISGRLAISRKTVENHKQRIFNKLQVRNQAHAVAVAMRAGLITVDGVLDLTDAAS